MLTSIFKAYFCEKVMRILVRKYLWKNSPVGQGLSNMRYRWTNIDFFSGLYTESFSHTWISGGQIPVAESGNFGFS